MSNINIIMKIFYSVLLTSLLLCGFANLTLGDGACICPDGTNGCPNAVVYCALPSGECRCGLCPGVPVTCKESPAPPSSNKDSKGGCIAANQIATVQDGTTKMLKQLVIGDRVLTDKGFQDYMGNIHEGGVHPTVTIYTKDKRNVELTNDHFIKTDKGFVHADKVKAGNILITRQGISEVIYVTNGTSYVVSPFTRSGTIIVNDIVLSCYATDRSHHLVNFVFFPVRIGITDDVNRYFKTLVKIYKVLPSWAKLQISAHTTVGM